ncbi:Imidazole glycerol phosphate synthase subunit HisH [Streptomyces californicus]
MSENKKKVVVFDYGFGNVRSAERALARVGADVEITRDYDRAMAADGLLVPGVGAFAACMEGLKRARGDWIVGRRLAGGRPVMGICVGMQILFERGIEHGVETEGLDEWPGTVGPEGRRRPSHGLEHRRRPRGLPALRRPGRRRALLLRALLRGARLVPRSHQRQDPCPQGHVVHVRRTVRGRRGERRAVGHPVPPRESPAMPAPSR